jgi:hypothetical protein
VITVVLLIARAHVTLWRGCTVPVPVLVIAAGLVVLGAVAWLAVRTVGEFRSPPTWQPTVRHAGPCAACGTRQRGGVS